MEALLEIKLRELFRAQELVECVNEEVKEARCRLERTVEWKELEEKQVIQRNRSALVNALAMEVRQLACSFSGQAKFENKKPANDTKKI